MTFATASGCETVSACEEQLFDEAVRSVLQVYSEMRDAIVELYDDPADVFAVSFRMTGRLQRQVPEMVRVLLHSGMSVLPLDEGLAPRARRDIIAAQDAGRVLSPPDRRSWSLRAIPAAMTAHWSQ